MPDREPLSGADNAWRRMGTAENLTAITGVLWFDEPITYEALCERLEERLLRFPRFRQRVGGRKRQFRQPYWESLADLDVETHVNHVALPEPQDEASLQRFVSTLLSRPLDPRRPLWEATLVEGAGDGGNAVVVRIDHSVGDGFALLYVMFGLVDDPDAVELPMGIVSDPPSADEFVEGTATDGGAVAAEDATASDGVASTDRQTGASGESEEGRPEPFPDDGGLASKAALLPKAAKTAWELLTQDDDAETSLRGDLGTAKRAGWTDEVPLEAVRALGEAHDATVNDVLLAALAGAFRRLLRARDEPVADRELRVTVPVNLEPMSARGGRLGNHFGLVFVPLPVGEPDLDARIAAVHDRMDAQKAGIEATLMYLTLTLGGRAPDPVFEWLLARFEGQATGVVTNVPGPVDAVEFAGREVTDIMFWVPQANDQGLGVSIFSYDGGVRVGVAADANLLSEPDRLTDAFEEEIDALLEELE